MLAGRYRVVRLLGKGGTGEVYEAIQENLGRPVAVKVLFEHLAVRRDCLGRLALEAKAAAGLGHPNIVQVTDFQANPNQPAFIVMELLEGRSLTRVLKEDGPLSPKRLVFITTQILSALDKAHSAGIIHRDLKPENIVLTSIAGVPDIVKLLDFGIAKLLTESDVSRLTATGFVPGTPAYMSPEQAKGQPVDARTDIYSLGVLLYRALAGRLPFRAQNYNAMTYAILNHTPPRLAKIRPDLDRKLLKVVERSMEKDPDRRYGSARELGVALLPWCPAGAAVLSQGGIDEWATVPLSIPPALMRNADTSRSLPGGARTTPVTAIVPEEEILSAAQGVGCANPQGNEIEQLNARATQVFEPGKLARPTGQIRSTREKPDDLSTSTTTLTRSAGEQAPDAPLRVRWIALLAASGVILVLAVTTVVVVTNGNDNGGQANGSGDGGALAPAANNSIPEATVRPDASVPQDITTEPDAFLVDQTTAVGLDDPAVDAAVGATVRPRGTKPDAMRHVRPQRRVAPLNRHGRLQLGILSASGKPAWAEVHIDGIMRGMTPLVVGKLKPGPHVVVYRRQGLPDIRRVVKVESGRTKPLVVKIK